MYFPYHGKNDVSLVIHLLGSATFSSAPYLYQKFISCVDDIALRSRYIDSRSKGDFRILEEIIAKYSTLFYGLKRISLIFLFCTPKYFLLRGGRLVTWSSSCFLFNRSRERHDTLSELSNLGNGYSFYTGSSL